MLQQLQWLHKATTQRNTEQNLREKKALSHWSATKVRKWGVVAACWQQEGKKVARAVRLRGAMAQRAYVKSWGVLVQNKSGCKRARCVALGHWVQATQIRGLRALRGVVAGILAFKGAVKILRKTNSKCSKRWGYRRWCAMRTEVQQKVACEEQQALIHKPEA